MSSYDFEQRPTEAKKNSKLTDDEREQGCVLEVSGNF